MKHKNIGPFLAFTKDWFRDHQRGLLFLLNCWLTRRWFKWCMRIRSCDIGYDREILEILPHCYTVAGDVEGTLTTDFRTHPKYAKRLYFAFRPLWWALHAWDWAVGERIGALCFGFATLTVYPDPDPETSTVDGYVSQSGVAVTFSTIRNGVGSGANDSSASALCRLEADTTSNTYAQLRREIIGFDTSIVGPSVSIKYASISIFVENTNTNLGDTNIDLAGATPASNTSLASSDYTNVSRTIFCSSMISGLQASSYNTFPLNESGVENINSSGASFFSAQLSWDVNDSFAGTWVSAAISGMQSSSADAAGTLQDPKLTIITTIPGGFPPPNRLRPRLFRPGLAR